MRVTTRSPNTANVTRRPIKRPARRARQNGIGLYAVLFRNRDRHRTPDLRGLRLFTSPPELAGFDEETETRRDDPIESETDGKGRCRQVAFDNVSGRFEEAGTGPCPNLIPEELLVETIRSRSS
jgi:hypothetical protein